MFLFGLPEILWMGSPLFFPHLVQLDQELIHLLCICAHKPLGSPVQPRIGMVERPDAETDCTLVSAHLILGQIKPKTNNSPPTTKSDTSVISRTSLRAN